MFLVHLEGIQVELQVELAVALAVEIIVYRTLIIPFVIVGLIENLVP